MTKVIFLIDKPEDQFTAPHERDSLGVFAYFPDEIASFKSPNNIYDEKNDRLCYSKTGQHSPCSTEYAKECKEANFNEYQDLLKELVQQGYKDLEILNSQEFTYNRQPTKFELKMGYGATFHRDFRLNQTGISKKGDLKKWFVASDDGLRYYR